MIEVTMTRDSVYMTDDVEAPHEQGFSLPDGGNLLELAHAVARSSYLLMPSDAWGWTFEVQDAVVAVRKGFLRRRVQLLRGDPSSITLDGGVRLSALYVRPDSSWRNA